MSAIEDATTISNSNTFTTGSFCEPVTSAIWNAACYSFTMVSETYSMIRMGLLTCYGLKKRFTYYGLNSEKLKSNRVILGLHGDNPGNQGCLLSLAEKINEACVGQMFTRNVKYNDLKAEVDEQQLMTWIEELRDRRPDPSQDLIVDSIGHSRGGIAFVSFWTHNAIKGVQAGKIITIASRLKVVPSARRPCPPDLVNRINAIQDGIKSRPDLQLFNIVPANDWDWLVPLEASCVVDPQHSRLIPNTSHTSILFANGTHRAVVEFLKRDG